MARTATNLWVIEGKIRAPKQDWMPIKSYPSRDVAREALLREKVDGNIVKLRVVPYKRAAEK